MKSLILAVGLVSMLAMGLSGCNEPPPSAKQVPFYTDEELRWMVQREITGDPRMPAHEIDVTADAETGEVVLEGRVTSERLRARAVELAKRAEPGLTIVDEIDVVPMGVEHENYTEDMANSIRQSAEAAGETIGESIEDACIYSTVVAELAMDDDTPARDIQVDVEQGNVTLRGEVPSEYSKSEAERIVKGTGGVESVDNELTVMRG